MGDSLLVSVDLPTVSMMNVVEGRRGYALIVLLADEPSR